MENLSTERLTVTITMPNYTKLFNSIVTSTIWTEDDRTRILWITILAIADQNGEVHASIPGLARLAGISIADAEAALERFLSPDPYSRTPDNEGRRIAPIDGGWEILNHAKYRKMASREDSREATAARVRRYRERKNGNACVTPVTLGNATVTQTLHIAEAETDIERSLLIESKPPTPKKTPKVARDIADEIYANYPRKVAKREALKAIKRALATETAESLLEAVKAYSEAVATWPEDERQFIPHPATWFNRGSYADDRTTWMRKGSQPHAKPAPKPIPAPENWQVRWLAHPDEPGLDRNKPWSAYTPQEQARMAAKIAEVPNAEL